MSKYTDIDKVQVFKTPPKVKVATGFSPIYGSFYDTTTQTVASGAVKAMEFNTTSLTCTNGVSITNNSLGRPTRITVSSNGVYDLQFSAQLNRETGGNTKQVDIWVRVKDLNVLSSNTTLSVQANAKKLVAAWNFYVYIKAGEYVEIMWTQDDSIDLLYSPENLVVPYPATPSVIATINKISI